MSKNTADLQYKECFTRFIFVQAIYQQAVNHESVAELVAQFQQRYLHSTKKQINWPLFQELLQALQARQQELDTAIEQLIHVPISEVNMVNMAIIRCGMIEIMMGRLPLELLISRYIRISISIGTSKGYALVNGIFDRAAKSHLIAVAPYPSKKIS
jgi:transcription termination factor NusB